ncbi:hypothetical protein SAY86_030281 [Trapa natans]|uniref:RING-CH-type domain-containing protein n=1 Tax=Trapa natans TaxID=22666 RepID=A0AAN7M2L1_TRANT|nr:hypothetical protein SAY86_030281 [Trapa natans]
MSSLQISSSPSPACDSAEVNRGDGSIPGKDSASEILQLEGSRASSAPTECIVEVADELDKRPPQEERDCRICHLSLEAPSQDAIGGPIELGCACKNDLSAAHRKCAEIWFRIKGNSTCEICGSVARNVSAAAPDQMMTHALPERWEDEEFGQTAVIAVPVIVQQRRESRRSFWPGHRFLNFLLACMVFAFIISWLLHFNFPS